MSSINIAGDTSGSVILTVPAAAGSSTITFPAGTGTVAVQGVSTNIVSGTAVASTSGTSIDFTSIPSWVKRITVMFSAVSTSGTSNPIVQVGSGSVTTSGYTGISWRGASASNAYVANSTGFNLDNGGGAASSIYGHLILTLISGSIYICSGTFVSGTNEGQVVTGSISLSGSLDRIRITTVNGTDTFDAGTINIMYE
jgi:hypothetical protein